MLDCDVHRQIIASLYLIFAVCCVQCISFIIICLVVYFIVVLPMNALMTKFFVGTLPPDSLRACLCLAMEPLR